MKIVIIGANNIAFLVAKRLSLEKHDITVIDHDLDRVCFIREKIDVLAIFGYGSDFKILEKAGIYQCDVILALSDIDEINIVSCTISKKCNVKLKIALINNITIFNSLTVKSLEEENIIMSKELGIDILINSSLKSAEKILGLMKYERSFEIIEFKEMNFFIQGYNIFSDSEICNKNVKDIREITGLDNILILNIIRNGSLLYPIKDEILLDKDKIYIISRLDEFDRISSIFNVKKDHFKPKNIFIIGISDITEALCQNFSIDKSIKDIKIFDLDFSKCVALKRNYSKYENIDVIQGNFTDINFLLEEGLSNIDLFISLSKDEKNMISSMISKEYLVKKTIAKIEKSDYLPFISKLGIDASINPNLLVVMEILKNVKTYTTILPLYTFEDKNLEIFSFKISETNRYLNIPISKINLSEDVIIVGIIRDNECIIPKGNDVLKLFDTLIIFSSIDSINQLDYVFG